MEKPNSEKQGGGPLGEIIRKEILDHLMSLRFAIACILCFVVILCSLFVRHQDYAQTLSAHHENAAINKTEMKKWNHPWRVVWQGIRVYHRPNPMKVFVRGVEDQNGYVVELASHSPPYFEAADLGNVLLPLFPSMDMVTFVGIIMSLLAIVFGYDAICGEKERGTLRLMLSYSVPRDKVLLGKWIGGFVTLSIPFLLSVLGGAAIMLVQPDISLTADQWILFSTVALLSLLYIAAVFSAAVWVSCMTGRSATSIMILVTLWMVLVLAVPNLSPYLAQTWRPTRNLQEVEVSRATQADNIWQEEVDDPMEAYDKAHGFGKNWWQTWKWDEPEERKKAELRRVYELEREREAHLKRLRMFSQIDEQFTRDLDRQITLGQWISRISPFTCFAMAAAELTDTGPTHKRRLLEQLSRHQATLCKYGHDEWLARQQYRIDNEGKRPPSWDKQRAKPMPEFIFTPSAQSAHLKRCVADGGILVGMTVVFFMFSYVSFLRYDVR